MSLLALPRATVRVVRVVGRRLNLTRLAGKDPFARRIVLNPEKGVGGGVAKVARLGANTLD